MDKYLAGGQEWLYPDCGDGNPPLDTKILILTHGGICTTGHWGPDCLGWLPLPKRNHDKEKYNTQRLYHSGAVSNGA